MRGRICQLENAVCRGLSASAYSLLLLLSHSLLALTSTAALLPTTTTTTPRASPVELAGCEDEAAIVCHNGHIKGQQGVALDDMVYVMTRMARQMEEVRVCVLLR